MVRAFKLEKFNDEKHRKYVKKWLKIRGLDRSMADELPELGFISFYNGIPVSAIFLRNVEGSGYGMIDSMVTDPRVDAEVRDCSNDLVVEKLLKEAKRLNYKKIIAFSTDKMTLTRANAFQFNVLPHSVIATDLGA